MNKDEREIMNRANVEIEKSEKEAALVKKAEEIQDACNMLAVANFLGQTIKDLGGHSGVYTHDAVRLIICKLSHLAELEQDGKFLDDFYDRKGL